MFLLIFKTVILRFPKILGKFMCHGDSSLHNCDTPKTVTCLNRKSTCSSVWQE